MKGEWEYLDSLNSSGKGSPVLSKEVRDLMKSVMRAEKKEGQYKKTPSHPVLSGDVVMFSEKVAGLEAEYLQNLAEVVVDLTNTDEGHLSMEDFVKSLACVRACVRACACVTAPSLSIAGPTDLRRTTLWAT